MKIIIEYKQQCPFLFAIYKVLSNINPTILWNSNSNSIYEIVHKHKPDLLIISENKTPKHWELINNIPYIVYGNNGGGKELIKLPIFDKDSLGFVDLLTYQNQFENHLFNTDILVSSNFFQKDIHTLSIMDKIFQETDFTIKCAGNTILPTPFFIGVTDEQSFMSIAKSSKIVICSNEIEKYSLLYNKIYACTIKEFSDNTYSMITEDRLRSKYIKKNRQEIIDKNRFSTTLTAKLFKAINLHNEANRIEQITDKLL